MAYLYSLFAKRTKSGAGYNIKLIGQPTNYFKIGAAVIGISFTVIAVLIVMLFTQNVMVLIAAVFISLGTGRQIFASALDVVTTNLNTFISSWASTLLLLAKSRPKVSTTDWSSIGTRVEMIIVSRRLEYDLPTRFDSSCHAFSNTQLKRLERSCRYMMNWKIYRKEVQALTQ
jgi:hypothetical protein